MIITTMIIYPVIIIMTMTRSCIHDDDDDDDDHHHHQHRDHPFMIIMMINFPDHHHDYDHGKASDLVLRVFFERSKACHRPWDFLLFFLVLRLATTRFRASDLDLFLGLGCFLPVDNARAKGAMFASHVFCL